LSGAAPDALSAGALGVSFCVSAGAALAGFSGGAVGAGVFGRAAASGWPTLGSPGAAAILDRVLPDSGFAGALPFAPGLAATVSDREPDAAVLAPSPGAAVFDPVLALVPSDGAGPAPSAAAGGPVGSSARAASWSSSARASR